MGRSLAEEVRGPDCPWSGLPSCNTLGPCLMLPELPTVLHTESQSSSHSDKSNRIS